MSTPLEFQKQQEDAFKQLKQTPLLKPAYFEIGMGYEHNMPCCVHSDTEPAVLDVNTGIFTPSWRARKEGWTLVKADTRFKRWLVKKLLTEDRC